MTYTITAPAAGHSETSAFGPVTLAFIDGKATTDELSDGLRAYLEGRGYEVTGGERKARQSKAAKPAEQDEQKEEGQ